jgi:DNA-binding NtrC family response regulator
LAGDLKMKNILFVDDDIAIIECYSDIFSLMGFNVVHADNADMAMEIYSGGMEFCAVIIDVGLPVRSGAEIAEIILERKPSQKIVLTSGYTIETLPERDREIVKRNKEFIFMTKPFVSKELMKIFGSEF